MGGEWEVIGDDVESNAKCKALGTACSSNDDCGGAKNNCYCRLKWSWMYVIRIYSGLQFVSLNKSNVKKEYV